MMRRFITLLIACTITFSIRAEAPAEKEEQLARTALADYVNTKDPAFEWKEVGRITAYGVQVVELSLTSQRWQDVLWKHRLLVMIPPKVDESHQGILMVTGGSWRQVAPISAENTKLPSEAQMLAGVVTQLQCPIAVLTVVPFQPMYNNLKEDALIAFTFDKFLNTGNRTWPLLLPMVKSVKSAMDALQDFYTNTEHLKIDSFTLTGASKRGWTTWLTAAIDPRITAAAPMVIDMLNLGEQLKHQIDVWGAPSPQVHNYTELKIFERINTPRGKLLQLIVDPFQYRDSLKQPKLIFLGANDPYWPADASNLYWDQLQGEKYLCIVPNAGHGLNNDVFRLVGGLRAIHQHVANGQPMPKMSWKFEKEGAGAVLRITSDVRPRDAVAWVARSKSRDFRDAKWESSQLGLNGDNYAIGLQPTDGGYIAAYGDLTFDSANPQLHLSTNLRIFPEK